MAFADLRVGQRFDGLPERRTIQMSANMQGSPDRWEGVVRSLLGLALVAGVAWALMHGGPMPGADLLGSVR
jgi:hypothetical protein